MSDSTTNQRINDHFREQLGYAPAEPAIPETFAAAARTAGYDDAHLPLEKFYEVAKPHLDDGDDPAELIASIKAAYPAWFTANQGHSAGGRRGDAPTTGPDINDVLRTLTEGRLA